MATNFRLDERRRRLLKLLAMPGLAAAPSLRAGAQRQERVTLHFELRAIGKSATFALDAPGSTLHGRPLLCHDRNSLESARMEHLELRFAQPTHYVPDVKLPPNGCFVRLIDVVTGAMLDCGQARA